MRRFVWTLAILMIAIGCSRQRQASLPEQASGWAKQGETRTFSAANLYDYIDGDAEKYVQAGVKTALTADYKYQGKADAVADVFIMSDAEGARKVFESQSEVGAKSISLGDAARLYSGSVTFRKGPYFVRLVAYQPQVSDALLDLGRAIETSLK
jgi:hypothetical protein